MPQFGLPRCFAIFHYPLTTRSRSSAVHELMATLSYHDATPYFSTLTDQYYPSYDAAFQDSLRNGGGAYNDFNLYLIHPGGTAEIVF